MRLYLKAFLVITGMLVTVSSAEAATGGPDGYGYTWVDSNETNGPAFHFITPTPAAITVIGNASTVAATATLVHPWSGIYGQKVSQLRVSRNGFITDLLSDPGNDETNDAPLPQPPSSGGGNRIYVLHDALRLDPVNGRVSYEYFPESPHPLHPSGVHVITWENIHHATGATNRFSMQALLFDNFDILLQYGAGNPELGSNSTTGIQNSDATIGLPVAANTPNSIPDNYAVRILPPIVVVNTAQDQVDTPAGPQLSLREAIRDAAPGSRIEFLSTYTITLSTNFASRIALNGRNLAIDGYRKDYDLFEGVVISGGDELRHFRLFNNAHLYLGHLRLIQGFGPATDLSGSTLVEQGSSLIAFETEWNENRTELDGGALAVRNSNTVVRLHGGALRMNRASGQGGAVALRNGATLHMEKVRMIANRADGGGGGLFAQASALDVRSSEFALNETVAHGGGVQIGPALTGVFFGVTFDDNRALNGGGVSIDNTIAVINPPSEVTFRRCTFSENLALIAGGAVYEDSENFFGNSAHPDFFYCTIVRNGAGVRGGGVATVKGQPRFSGVCLALNTTGATDNNFHTTSTGTAVSLGENLESGTDAGFTGILDLQNTDPMLSALGYHGGPVRTCMPLAGSPLIDAAALQNFWTGADARGVGAPPFDGNGNGINLADIGAVEVGPTVWVSSSSVSALQAAIDSAQLGGVIRFSNVNVIANAALTFPTQTMVLIQAAAAPLTFEDLSIHLTHGVHQSVALHGIDLVMGPDGALYASGRASLSIERADIRKLGVGPDFVQTSIFHSDSGRLSINQVDMRDGSTSRALWLASRAQAWMRDSMIRENELSSYLMISQGRSELYLQRSSLIGNRGFLMEGASLINGYYVVENTTLSGNVGLGGSATNRYVLDFRPNPQGSGMFMRNNTVAYNLNRRGVRLDIFAPSRTVFANNLVVFNTGLAIFVETSDGGNLTTWPFFGGATSNDFVNTDPLLYPLSMGRNGTLHHALRPASPAIDTGVSSYAGIRDGRLGLRYRNGTGAGGPQQDIGAVESGRILTVTTALDEDNGALGLGAGNSLRECLQAATNFGRAVNIDLSLIQAAVPTNVLNMNGIQADLDALASRTRFSPASVLSVRVRSNAMVSVYGGQFVSGNGGMEVLSQSTLSVQNGLFQSLTNRALIAMGTSRVYLAATTVADQAGGSGAMSLSDETRGELDRVTFARNAVTFTLFQVQSGSQLGLRRTTVKPHAHQNGSYLANVVGGRLTADQSTLYRIARRMVFSVVNPSDGWFRDTIYANISDGVVVTGNVAAVRSLGGNISDRELPFFDTNLGDRPFRNPYLAPLFDHHGNGVATFRPLAISPAFNTRTGAHPPPTQIITVTTLADENDTPAGAQISLREAIRDIADGGVIVFDPLLNNGTIELTLNSSAINTLNKSVTIDATTLPHGITIIGRLVSTSPGRTLGLHGIHFRNHDPGFAVGGAVAIQNGNLVGSHLAFSRLNSDQAGGAIYLEGGQLVLENVTFSSNSAPSGAAIGLVNATGTIEFATFGEQRGSAAAVIEGANARIHLHGSVFFKNERSAFSGVTLVSEGYNAFPGNPAGTIGTDSVNNGTLATAYDRFNWYGGWVWSYRPNEIATNVMNTLPLVMAGTAPPPLSDARGFIRVAGASADWGAHEFGGGTFDSDGDGLYDWWELAQGFDPNTFTDPDQDLDGDGWSLIEEQGWGTDPFSTNSSPGAVLTIAGTGPYTVEARVNSIAGELYYLRGTTNVTTLGGYNHEVAIGNGFPMVLTAPLPFLSDTRFYRLEKAVPFGVW